MSKDKTKMTPDKMDVERFIEIIRKAENISKRELYFNNFTRGIFFGAGSLLGATIVITAVLWLLSLFDTVPFIGPIVENARENIRQNR